MTNGANPQGNTRSATVWAVSEYYHPNFSGAAIQAHRILSRLALRGFSVHVLTAADQAARHLAGNQGELDGVRVHYLPVVRRRDWKPLASRPRLLHSARSFNDVIRDYSFHRQIRAMLAAQARVGDIVQWYIVGEFTWAVLRAARRAGLRTVIQISLIGADDPSSFRSSLFGISTSLKRRCFFQVDRVIGLSQALTDSCRNIGLDQNHVVRIPNGVDLTQFPASNDKRLLRASLGLDVRRRYLIFVGSAIHRKGIDVVIPAYVEVAKAVADVDLLIVGPCDFRDTTRHDPSRQQLIAQLRQQLADDNLTDRVHWVGQVSNVADYLQAADVFLFPTRREGLPNAMAEAMACGLPVVASLLPGITTDLVDDAVEGRLIAGHNPLDYARTLISLCQDVSQLQSMGVAARRRIEREFDLEQIVGRYEDLYEQLDR